MTKKKINRPVVLVYVNEGEYAYSSYEDAEGEITVMLTEDGFEPKDIKVYAIGPELKVIVPSTPKIQIVREKE